MTGEGKQKDRVRLINTKEERERKRGGRGKE